MTRKTWLKLWREYCNLPPDSTLRPAMRRLVCLHRKRKPMSADGR